MSIEDKFYNSGEQKTEKEKLEGELFVREVPPEYERLIEEADLIRMSEVSYSEFLVEEVMEKDEALKSRFKGGTVLDLGSGGNSSVSNFAKKAEAERYIGVDLEEGSQIGPAIINNYVEEDVATLQARLNRTSYVMTEEEKKNSQPITSREELDSIEPPEENTGEEEDGGNNRPVVSIEALRNIKPPKNNTKIREEAEAAEEKERQKLFKTHEPVIKEMDGIDIRISSDMLNLISRLGDDSISALVLAGIEAGMTNNNPMNWEYFTALKTEIKRVLKSKGLVFCHGSDMSFSQDKDFQTVKNNTIGLQGGVYEKI